MPFRTILVHVTADDSHAARLELALDFSRRFKSHLTGLFTSSPVTMPAAASGRAASHAFLAEAVAIARERGQSICSRYTDKASKEAASTWTWIEADGDHLDVLTHYANLSDLAIVAQSEPHTLEDAVALQIPDQLGLHAACPVLVVPTQWTHTPIGKKVLVAWKDKREATRAVREALPILRAAAQVVVLAPTTEKEGFRPGRDLDEFLRRHDVTGDFRASTEDRHAGETICDLAENEECDMIVMGAYGHSRLMEIALGGATRYVLKHMTRPVFMAH